ncbi:MAG: GNAT family N-acetyltransferase [Ilumatobacteraceae bacterium]
MTDPVVTLPTADILGLRVRVLRKGTPFTHASYPEDSYPDVVNFCVVRDGEPVATSTWFSKECPEMPGVPAVQLKGMAVDDSLQGSGLGALLIVRGIEHARSLGAKVVWARARDSALYFYERRGFRTAGDGFIDEPTAMPHHIVLREV